MASGLSARAQKRLAALWPTISSAQAPVILGEDRGIPVTSPMDIAGGPSTTTLITTPLPPLQSTMESRGRSLLGKRIAPKNDQGRSNPRNTGPNTMGLGEQVGAENVRRLPTHSGPTTIECAPSGPEDQVRNAQHGTIFEQVTGRWGLHRYVVGILCFGDRCGFSVVYVFLSGWVILC